MNQKTKTITFIIVIIAAALAIIYWLPKPAAFPSGENPTKDGEFCIQVITPAKNPKTGEVKEFPTPCDVPEGWELVTTDNIEVIQ